jgi:DNA-directed RNA polymerase specialized sigma24 family protein
VAERLNCSVDYVYLQKHRALKKLRDLLMDGGGHDGKL